VDVRRHCFHVVGRRRLFGVAEAWRVDGDHALRSRQHRQHMPPAIHGPGPATNKDNWVALSCLDTV
jgi:hypothetical protein